MKIVYVKYETTGIKLIKCWCWCGGSLLKSLRLVIGSPRVRFPVWEYHQIFWSDFRTRYMRTIFLSQFHALFLLSYQYSTINMWNAYSSSDYMVLTYGKPITTNLTFLTKTICSINLHISIHRFPQLFKRIKIIHVKYKSARKGINFMKYRCDQYWWVFDWQR